MIVLLFISIAAAIVYFTARSRREQQPENELRAVMTDIPAAGRNTKNSGRFELKVEDVFSISGRGIVVTGQVTSGKVRVGDSVMIRRRSGQQLLTSITGIEMFRKTADVAVAGMNVGLLLEGVEKNSIASGDRITALGS